MSKSDKMTNFVSYPFLSEKDADQQLVEKDFLMKRSIRTFGKECSWPNVSSDLPLSCSLISISPFSCTQTIFLSLSHSLPLLHPLSLSHTHTIFLSISYTLSYSLSHTQTILHSVSYTLYLTLWLIHTVFLSISYTHYLTLAQ